MKKWMFWLSWIILFISSAIIGVGAYVEIKWGLEIGLAYTFIGVIGLAASGLTMTIAYGDLDQ